MKPCRLSDLFAPEWLTTLGGETYRMRPLSLDTFAELEGRGWDLAAMSTGDFYVWTRVFAYLAGLPSGDDDIEELAARFMSSPSDLKLFQHRIAESFYFESDKDALKASTKKRKVVNPNEKSEDNPDSNTDVSFILLVARQSGISLADISRMSYRGVRALQQTLEDMPPTPQGLI